MDNIIINGDLYIKIAPTIVYKNTSLKKSDLSEAEMMDLLTKKIDVDVLKKILSNIGEIMDEKARNGEIKRERIEEYDQNIGFYRIFASSNVIFLVNEYDATGNVVYADVNVSDDCENIYDYFMESQMPNNILDYNDINDVNKEFIRLYDFIMNASFVGSYLETKFKDMPRYIVLYEYLDTYLLQNVIDNSYVVVSMKHSLLDNYYFGEKVDGTYDKMMVYQDIFKQKVRQNRDGNSRK